VKINVFFVKKVLVRLNHLQLITKRLLIVNFADILLAINAAIKKESLFLIHLNSFLKKDLLECVVKYAIENFCKDKFKIGYQYQLK
jgi:hypothetical protein